MGRWLTAVGVTAALVMGAAATRAESAPRPSPPNGAPVVRSVTLLTGDVVQVATRRDGRRSVSLVAGPDGRVPQATITRSGSHLYVIPRAAMPLLAAGRVDRALFDVAGLL